MGELNISGASVLVFWNTRFTTATDGRRRLAEMSLVPEAGITAKSTVGLDVGAGTGGAMDTIESGSIVTEILGPSL